MIKMLVALLMIARPFSAYTNEESKLGRPAEEPPVPDTHLTENKELLPEILEEAPKDTKPEETDLKTDSTFWQPYYYKTYYQYPYYSRPSVHYRYNCW